MVGRIACLGMILWFAACALPPEGRENQTFIPDDELLTVSLVREGQFYFGRSRYFDAEVRFRQALRIYPGADNVRVSLAVALEYQGQYREAESIYSDLLKQNPDDTQILAGLARLCSVSGRFEEAKQYYQKAFAVAFEAEEWERAAQFARSLSALSFKFGDEPAAICFSQQALLIRRNEADMARHARLLIAAGYYQKTRAELSGYTEDRKAGVDAALLHAAALAQYGLGDSKEAAHLEELAENRGKSSPGIEGEVRLVRFVASDFKRQAEKEGEEDGDAAAQAENPVEMFFAAGGHLGGAMLYWPVNLMEKVLQYAKEQGFYDPKGAGAKKEDGSWLRHLNFWE